MTAKSKQISVFAIVSFLIYLLTAIESSPLLVANMKFSLFLDGHLQEFQIPHINIIFTIIFSIIALRLFLHAWAVDESPVFKKLSEESSSNKKNYSLFFEWIIRILWVLMVTYLPNIFANEKIVILNTSLSWELYFITIFGLIFLWDSIMISDIIKHSQFVNKNPSKKDLNKSELKRIWRRYDIYLFVLSGLIFVNDVFPWNGVYANYKSPLFFVLLSIMFGICITQISKWGYEIYYSLKSVEENELEQK